MFRILLNNYIRVTNVSFLILLSDQQLYSQSINGIYKRKDLEIDNFIQIQLMQKLINSASLSLIVDAHEF
ncbi:unnamed protein product [Paramecium sonneborni]|uniref:Uncharacterized protein n=1 Tax=Paramecium sonneborni TaxID=65129 RepID=A0A8S1MVF7_9CILI|nr:unnamed protein product [Paramecium sonneborni]